MPQQQDRLSYINTLIFTIFAALLSIALLFLVFLKATKEYIVFIVTVEVGLLAIIFYCIYKIVKSEKDLRSLRDASKLVVKFDECADYYVRRMDSDNNVYCSNDYIFTKDNDAQYLMKIYPESVSLPNNTLNNASSNAKYNPNAGRYEEYLLQELATASNLPTYADKCKPLFTNVNNYTEYSKIPWTFARSRCQSFYQ